jgi:predicted ribosomally synthesized peptide with nif11-like leader
MFTEKIVRFCKKLGRDRSFLMQVKNAQSLIEYQHIFKAFGFNFTEEELKELTNFLSESNLTDADIKDLSEMELGTVIGGQMQQIYGAIRPTRPRLTV